MFLQVEKGSQLHFFLRAVLQGFQQGVLVQQALAGQVGHRAGHPQNAARSSRSAPGVMRQMRRTCPALSWAL